MGLTKTTGSPVLVHYDQEADRIQGLRVADWIEQWLKEETYPEWILAALKPALGIEYYPVTGELKWMTRVVGLQMRAEGRPAERRSSELGLALVLLCGAEVLTSYATSKSCLEKCLRTLRGE